MACRTRRLHVLETDRQRRGWNEHVGRNTQQGFGVNNWDMGINKDFPISKLGEASRLQLRFEFFNVFNHTQFNNAATAVNVVNFGLVNSARDPRILQIAGKLYW